MAQSEPIRLLLGKAGQGLSLSPGRLQPDRASSRCRHPVTTRREPGDGGPRGWGESAAESWAGGGPSKPLPRSRASCACQCILATSTWSWVFGLLQTRLLSSSRPEVQGDWWAVQGGWCPCLAASVQPARPRRTRTLRTAARPVLPPPRPGVMGLIYCRKPLKAQELWRACDNRHKACI